MKGTDKSPWEHDVQNIQVQSPPGKVSSQRRQRAHAGSMVICGKERPLPEVTGPHQARESTPMMFSEPSWPPRPSCEGPAGPPRWSDTLTLHMTAVQETDVGASAKRTGGGVCSDRTPQ